MAASTSSIEKTATRKKALFSAQARLEKYASKLETLDKRFAFFRLLGSVVALAVLSGAWANLNNGSRVAFSFLLVAFFVAASRIHNRVQKKAQSLRALALSMTLTQARTERVSEVYAQHASPWHKSVSASVEPGHIYSNDLDVHTAFFELFDTCSTPEGSKKLFSWLMSAGVSPVSDEERITRQRKTKSLSKLTSLLRNLESLRLQESYVADATRELAQSESQSSSEALPELQKGVVVFQVLFGLASIGAWAVLLLPALIVFAQTGNTEILLGRLSAYVWVPILGVGVFYKVTEAAGKLRRRAVHLKFLLRYFRTLRRLPDFQNTSSMKLGAEKELSHFVSLLSFMEVRGNPVLWLLVHALFPFDAVLSLLMLRSFQKVGPHFRAWWEEVVELDVLCALARFASENPESQFFESTGPSNEFCCESLRHPLLAAEVGVPNSLQLTQTRSVVLLTGSNMSGKSTFLRALGLNMLLFNLGSAVLAKEFRTPPRRLFCAIRIDDSIEEATSYFYAEVKRLRQVLVELEHCRSQAHPALFLIDEIFRGTNNRERFLGSWHIIGALMNTNSFGLVSTHDLALTELAEKDERLRNMHFRETVQEGKLDFDYHLREGPCPTTNALRIMSLEGLPIPKDLLS